MMKTKTELQKIVDEFKNALINVLSQENIDLNDYVKGTALVLPDNLPEEFSNSLNKLMGIAESLAKESDNLEDLWKDSENSKYHHQNSLFINWLKGYMNSINLPYTDATFLREKNTDDFNKISLYCFDNLIIKNIGFNNIDGLWDKKQILTLRKIMFTFIDLVVIENYSKEYVFEFIDNMFGIDKEYSNYWWNLVEKNENKLWRIMIAKHHLDVEQRIDELTDFVLNSNR